MIEHELPTGESIKSSRLETDFSWRKIVPPKANSAAFKVLLPNVFKQAELPADGSSSLEFVTLARFADENRSSDIVVQRQRVPREVSAAHWLRVLALQSGKDLEVLNAANVRFADARVGFSLAGGEFKARLAVLVSGGYAYILQAMAPVGYFKELAADFGMFVATWELVSPTGVNQIESRRQVRFDSFAVEIPASWKVKPSSANGDLKQSVVLANLDDNGELNGVLRLTSGKITGSNTWLEGIEDTLAFWKSMDLPDSEVMVQDVPEVGLDWVRKASMVRFALSGPGAGDSSFEGWVMAMFDGARWLTISLLTPPESDLERLYVWAFNHRAFQIACATLKKT